MARRHLLFAAVAASTFALPASADVLVLGSSNARICYLASEATGPADMQTMQRCDDAIIEERHDLKHLVATHVNRGILRLRRGDVEGALSDFDAATRLSPDEPEAYLNRASIFLRLSRTGDAISQFDAALAKNTRRPALAYYGRGVAHEVTGNLRAAYRDYSRAAELAPEWADPRNDLSRFRVVRN